MHNTGTSELVIAVPYCNPTVLSCFNAPVRLGPGGIAQPIVYADNGVFLSVLKPADAFAAQFRIRDLSRQTQTWGPEVPVVNTSEFRQRIDLLDIPTDPRFHLTLKVYATGTASANIQMFPLIGPTSVLDETVNLIGQAEAAPERSFPA